jgi:hypothetical protein
MNEACHAVFDGRNVGGRIRCNGADATPAAGAGLASDDTLVNQVAS